MIGRTNAGGGGGGLNFKVVGGSAQPENPKENTIWVETDGEIPGWVFSASMPTNPVAGMVWISTGINSTAEFNALKKNGICIYPISAKQYSAGVWNVKTAKSYMNGEWAELWNGYLFHYGDELKHVTGGYTAIAKPLVSGTGSGVPYISNNSDGSRKIQSNRANTDGGMYYTVNKIDLTDYKTLKFYGRIVDPSGYTRAGIGVWSDIGAYANTNRVVTVTGNDASSNTRSIDVSGLTGKYYIGFFVYATAPYVTVEKMWLEQ